jgi:DNA-binding GntR family transcriptional regulator
MTDTHLPEVPLEGGAGSLAERVYEALRSEILDTRLPPGEAISEPALAERLGVSKTPVREALRLLVHDGLVLVLPRKGYVVRPVGFDDVIEVLSLRHILEPPLAADAALRRLPHHVEQMRALLDEDRSAASSEVGVEPGLRQHELIAEIAGNGRAVTVMRSLLDESRRINLIMAAYQAEWQAADLSEHARLIDAIEARDPETASKEMAAHLDAMRQRMVGGLERLARRI